MGGATISRSRTVLIAWTLALIIGFAAIAGGDYAMLRYAKYLKSQDYEAFVSDAGICIENKDYAGAQTALREALSEYFSARYSRSHKAALRALTLRLDSPLLVGDAEFAVLAQLLAAGSLHRLQDRSRRDEVMKAVFADKRTSGGHRVV